MKEHIIRTDIKKCIGCGLCVQDCPANNILLSDKKAVIKAKDCIKCGHCVAICPKYAITMTGFDEPPAEYNDIAGIDPQKLLAAIKTRRSIRQFKDRPVPLELIRQVIEAGRFTPTAKNAQDVSYIVLNDKIEKYEKTAVRFFRRLLPFAKLFYPAAKNMTIDENFFFNKAPVAILVLSKDKIDGALAASNMALMAESCGLGVLYSGFFTIAANHSGALRKTLGLGHRKAVTTLVLGYSNVTYRRTTQKETAFVQYL